LISIVERAAAYEEWARTRLHDFGERMRGRLMLGAFVSGVDYVQGVRRRRELRAELQAAMGGLDVVLDISRGTVNGHHVDLDRWETIEASVIAPDESSFVLGTRGNLREIDLDGKSL
jgi:Asp-tRNA(Asn)/Glu-tRNA(Gln) amidotransferase A subunit family amidase